MVIVLLLFAVIAIGLLGLLINELEVRQQETETRLQSLEKSLRINEMTYDSVKSMVRETLLQGPR